MSAEKLPKLLRYSEYAFAGNFVAFSFVIFSSSLPTGFVSTFSGLAVIFALPIFFYRLPTGYLNHFEIFGMALFAWLTVSILWSRTLLWQSIVALSEYRIFLIVPIFISVLAFNKKIQYWAFRAAIFGALFAVIASYGLGLGWWSLSDSRVSLGDRIYHGFVMSCLILTCLVIAREYRHLTRGVAIIVALAAVYNVTAVEVGRTGYLQAAVVILILCSLSFSFLRNIVVCIACLVISLSLYIGSERFSNRVNETVANIEQVQANGGLDTSVGKRLAYYRGAVGIGIDYPWSGVGVGDAEEELAVRAQDGRIELLTDNVHSEFLNMLIIGGLPAVLLFCGFIVAMVYQGLQVRGRCRLIGDFIIGLSGLVVASALFNSTIKDFGEKHALIIVLSLVGARLVAMKPGDSINCQRNR